MNHLRRLTLVGSVIGALTLLLGLALATYPATAQDGTGNSDNTGGTPAATPSSSPTVAPAYTFAVDAAQSTARYRAQEELSGIGANEAVGETQAIIGTLLFDENYLPLAGSRVDVDLRTLTSDETRRDNFLYDNVLETGTYPLATFIVTGVEGLDGGLADGEEATFTLVGDLTLHGVTNEARWEVTATRTGDNLTGAAATSFVLADYDMEKPIIGPVVSIDDDIALEIDVTAAKTDA